MRICIIAEGNYPYTVGGVSSWIQMLINSMPEHQFIIYSIGAEEKEKGIFRYKLPGNVEDVKEAFLDIILKEEGTWGKRYSIDSSTKEAMIDLLAGRGLDWNSLFSYLRSKEIGNISDFLMSKSFFDILQDVYRERYSQTSFNDLFWTIRAMILPLLYIIRQDIPVADLYHSVSTGYAGIVGSLAKHLYNKPFVLTEHGIYTREREEEIIKSDWVKIYFKDTWIEYFYGLSKCAYDSADKVITLFNRNMDIQLELGCDPYKTNIIPNGIEVDDFMDIPGKDSSDGYINVGAVVRVVPIKDIKTMLMGFASAKDKISKIRLYIIGPLNEDKDYFEECKQFIESLGIQDVIFTGNVDVKEYLGRMDMMVLSSISEGQPLAILESMACKKPIIATDVGSCRELIYGSNDSYGNAGIIVPVMDYEKMGGAILKLAGNEQMRNIMGNSGFNRVSRLYTREKLITAYKNIYSSYEVI